MKDRNENIKIGKVPIYQFADDELFDYLRDLEDTIDKADCFGVRDLILREAIGSELARRGLS
jgi:hypothetical protein